MLFFMFECRPSVCVKKLARYGGAYVNCWVDEDNRNKAERLATDVLASEGWEVTQIEEAYPITKADYEQNSEGLQHFLAAEQSNLSLVFCAWPVGEC